MFPLISRSTKRAGRERERERERARERVRRKENSSKLERRARKREGKGRKTGELSSVSRTKLRIASRRAAFNSKKAGGEERKIFGRRENRKEELSGRSQSADRDQRGKSFDCFAKRP